MQILETSVNYLLGLGASVFMPLIMIMIGLIVKMKFKDAVSSGLTLGVAFLGMSTIIGFMMGTITPASQGLVERTGVKLDIIDVGWPALASLAWAWKFAFIMFPVQLIVNALMLMSGKTKTLNVDMWNVWQKIFMAVIVYYITGSTIVAFTIAAIQVVLELILSDVNQPTVEKITGIPGVTVSHAKILFCVFLLPFDWLLRKIPIFNKHIDANYLKDKMGIFAENHVLGFIIGLGLGIAAGYSVADTLTLAISAATALTLLPMVAKLFMQALSPISDAISTYMRKRFEGRELNIGLDWPIVAGSSEIWVTMILMVPVQLLFAFILPGNELLPFAGIINVAIGLPVLLITGGNVLRMIALGTISVPVFLLVGTYFSDTITNLATETGAVALEVGQRISYAGIDYPVFRFMVSEMLKGKWWGILLCIGWVALLVVYIKCMNKRNQGYKNAEEMVDTVSEAIQ